MYKSSGLLTGKNKRGAATAEGSRIDLVTKKIISSSMFSPDMETYNDNEKYWQINDLLQSIAEKHGRSKWT